MDGSGTATARKGGKALVELCVEVFTAGAGGGTAVAEQDDIVRAATNVGDCQSPNFKGCSVPVDRVPRAPDYETVPEIKLDVVNSKALAEKAVIVREPSAKIARSPIV